MKDLREDKSKVTCAVCYRAVPAGEYVGHVVDHALKYQRTVEELRRLPREQGKRGRALGRGGDAV